MKTLFHSLLLLIYTLTIQLTPSKTQSIRDIRFDHPTPQHSSNERKDSYFKRWIEKNEVEAVPISNSGDVSPGDITPWLEASRYNDDLDPLVKINDFKFGKFESNEEIYGLSISPRTLKLQHAQVFIQTGAQISVTNLNSRYNVQVQWFRFENPLMHGSFNKPLPISLEPGETANLKMFFRPRDTEYVRSTLIISILFTDRENPRVCLLRSFVVYVESQPVANVYEIRESTKVTIKRNESYLQTVTIKNPFPVSIQVRLIPTTAQNKPFRFDYQDLTKKKIAEQVSFIELKPNATYTIAKFGFSSPKAGVYKFNFGFETCYHEVEIPFEFQVLRDGLNIFPTWLDFGIITTLEELRYVSLYATNLGSDTVKLLDVINIPSSPEIKIDVKVKRTIIKPGENNILIAKAYVIPDILQRPFQFKGKILLRTNETNELLEIPFFGAYFLNLVKVLNLRDMNFALNPNIPEFISNQKSIFLSKSLDEPETYELQKTLTVISNMSFPLTITSYFIADHRTQVMNLNEAQSLRPTSSLNISLQHIFNAEEGNRINSKITLNLYSFGLIFAIPIGFFDMKTICRFYDNQGFSVVEKCENLGERISAIDFGYFMLNQVEITVEKEIDLFKRPVNISSMKKREFNSYILKPDHELVLKIQPISSELGEFEGTFIIETDAFERLRLRYKFEILEGNLEMTSPSNVFKSAFIGIKQTQAIKIRNTFPKRCDISYIISSDPRVMPELMKLSLPENSEDNYLHLHLDSTNRPDENNILEYVRSMMPNAMLSYEDLSVWQTIKKLWQKEVLLGRTLVEANIVMHTNIVSPLEFKVVARLEFPRISPTSLTFQPIPQFTDYRQSILIKNPSDSPIFVEFYLVPEEFQYEGPITDLLNNKNITTQPIRSSCQSHRVYSSIDDYLNQKQSNDSYTNVPSITSIDPKYQDKVDGLDDSGPLYSQARNCKLHSNFPYQMTHTNIPFVQEMNMNVPVYYDPTPQDMTLSLKITNYLRSFLFWRKKVSNTENVSKKQSFFNTHPLGHMFIIPPYSSKELTPVHVFLEKEYDSGLLLIKNNLTGIETVKLEAYSGKLSLRLIKVLRLTKNKRALLTDPLSNNKSGLYFVITRGEIKYLKEIGSYETSEAPDYIEDFERIFVVKNEGNIPIKTTVILVDGRKCGSYGVEIVNCHPFSLLPGETHELIVRVKNQFIATLEEHKVSLLSNNQTIPMDLYIYVPLELIPQSIYFPELSNLFINNVFILFIIVSLLPFLIRLKMYWKSKNKGPTMIVSFDILSEQDPEEIDTIDESDSDITPRVVRHGSGSQFTEFPRRRNYLSISPLWYEIPTVVHKEKEEIVRQVSLEPVKTIEKEKPVVIVEYKEPEEKETVKQKSIAVMSKIEEGNNMKKLAKLKYKTAMQKKEEKLKKLAATAKIIEQKVKVKPIPIVQQEPIAQITVKKSDECHQEEVSTLYSSLDKEAEKTLQDEFDHSSISSDDDGPTWKLKEGADEIMVRDEDIPSTKVGMIGEERKECKGNTPKSFEDFVRNSPNQKLDHNTSKAAMNAFRLFPDKLNATMSLKQESPLLQSLISITDFSPNIDSNKKDYQLFKFMSNPGHSSSFDLTEGAAQGQGTSHIELAHPPGVEQSKQMFGFNQGSALKGYFKIEEEKTVGPKVNPLEVTSLLEKLEWRLPESGEIDGNGQGGNSERNRVVQDFGPEKDHFGF